MKTQSIKSLVEIYDLEEKLDIEKFCKILSYPLLNLIRETIDYTRSYEVGLETWLNLLDFAEKNKQYLNKKSEMNILKIFIRAYYTV